VGEENIEIREMLSGEEEAVCNLVLEVFDRFVASQFSQRGIEEFRDYLRVEALKRRAGEGHIILLAVENDALLGMIEMRQRNHISLLFVREAHQGRGIGRELVSHAVTDAAASIQVHASLNSVGFYRKAGFLPEGPERIEHGICYIPMRMDRVEMG
jgi:GNAT superfamily N-acetyltransferase